MVVILRLVTFSFSLVVFFSSKKVSFIFWLYNYLGSFDR